MQANPVNNISFIHTHDSERVGTSYKSVRFHFGIGLIVQDILLDKANFHHVLLGTQ
jgi:hypothetical protein